ncbi:MAG: integrase family protein, partial [Pseudomonadota bacterium]
MASDGRIEFDDDRDDAPPTRGPRRKGVKLTRSRILEGVAHAKRKRRDIILWCVEPRGFGCRIRASGAASYIFQYRARGGRRAPVRKLTIGKLETYAPDEARGVARRHAQTVAEGGDPQMEKMALRRTPSLRELFDLYLSTETRRLAPKTIDNMRSHMRAPLAPLAARPIDTIRKSDVAHRMAQLADTPYAANRALATLSALFSFAEQRDLTPPNSNPAKGVRRYPERHRERMMTADEVAALWSALIDLQAEQKHRFAAPAIMLGMLTGWRVGEVRTLRWDAVDMVVHEATILGKTGPRRAPFPRSTHRLLHYLLEVSAAFGQGRHRGAWVFPALAGAAREQGPLSDWEHRRSWEKAVAAAGLRDVRRHDLRHLIAGVIGLQTGSALRVKEAMGHRSLAMSERYVAPISALQRRSTDQAAALVLAIAEREKDALPSPMRSPDDAG